MNLLTEINKKRKKYPVEIRCTRDELPFFFKEMGYQRGAEIGVLFGAFSKQLCQAGLKVFAIDPWRAFEHHLARNPDYQKKMDAIYKKAVKELTNWEVAPFRDCEIIRMTSMEAVEKFEDNSLDFVFIDANHGFRYIAEDISEWSKKVRSGGVVSGHDYHLSEKCQVAPVVDAYVKAFGIKEWYILGNTKVTDTSCRNSWMWVKP